jgi:hypothetical protein
MAARAGMANLIDELRARCNAGSADYSLAGDTYWVDDQLQTTLDRHRCDYQRQPLRVDPIQMVGSAVYHDYYWQRGDWVEEGTSGTAAWRVENSAGSVISESGYVVNYVHKHIRFTADQMGTAYYLSYRAYDLDRAAADVWARKAAHVTDRFDLSTDNHKLSRRQLHEMYTAQAKYYRSMAPARSVTRVRDDIGGETY